jgi:hypothetical protein
MSLIIKKVPRDMPEGLNNVTITRVEDLGLQETRSSGKKKMAAIHFTADELGYADARLKVIQSLHLDTNLAKLLRQLDIPVADTFDLGSLVGIGCQVVIQHIERDGETCANVVAVLKQARAVVVCSSRLTSTPRFARKA